MIKTFVHISTCVNPYENLAAEEHFLSKAEGERAILYLWQNHHTIVIGRNQNPWMECDFRAFEADGGRLARRMSGGGAVYHDLGNLNFTFLTGKKLFDKERQSQVILNALRALGLDAQKSGRNDLTIDEKKFSGNAYFIGEKSSFHHGTILVGSDLSKLSKYLIVSKDKIESKGIKSVRSRVVNLRDINPSITVDEVKSALISAFEAEYGAKASPLLISKEDEETISSLTKKYESDEFRISRTMPFDMEIYNRFPWGSFTARMLVKNAAVEDIQVFSDAMEEKIFEQIESALISSPLSAAAFLARLAPLRGFGEQCGEIIDDITDLFFQRGL